ncbi:uncharacterized protein [Diabrotica undecimpunctata]|uniref:uncharacterized protein n=1 Tax=Diabrotica undecimpunctata TaxID=50387 RepID=UPI003B640DFE
MYCAVLGCLNNNNKKSKTFSKCRFFVFPRDKQMRKVWVSKCFRQDKFNVETARICSKHFTEADYCLKEKLLGLPDKQWKLKNDAIPSLHLIKTTSAKTSPENRREERLEKRNILKNINDPMEVKQEPSDFSEEYMIQQDNIEFSLIGFPYSVKNEISEDLFKADLPNTDTNNDCDDSNTFDKVCMEVDVEDIKLEELDKPEKFIIIKNGIVIKDEIEEEVNEYEQIDIDNQFVFEDFKVEPLGGYYSDNSKKNNGGRPKKYKNEEERIAARRERDRQHRANRSAEERAKESEYKRQYRAKANENEEEARARRQRIAELRRKQRAKASTEEVLARRMRDKEYRLRRLANESEQQAQARRARAAERRRLRRAIESQEKAEERRKRATEARRLRRRLIIDSEGYLKHPKMHTGEELCDESNIE